jgi:hypothetical protein
MQSIKGRKEEASITWDILIFSLHSLVTARVGLYVMVTGVTPFGGMMPLNGVTSNSSDGFNMVKSNSNCMGTRHSNGITRVTLLPITTDDPISTRLGHTCVFITGNACIGTYSSLATYAYVRPAKES